jgi:hypothetical protein
VVETRFGLLATVDSSRCGESFYQRPGCYTDIKGKVWLIREFSGITFEKDFSAEPTGVQ